MMNDIIADGLTRIRNAAMRKMEMTAAIKTGSRNASSCSPRILIDVLDRIEKRLCWLFPAYWNRSCDGVEATCSR